MDFIIDGDLRYVYGWKERNIKNNMSNLYADLSLRY